MKTTINIEKARELGLPIPENAAAMILYFVAPAEEVDRLPDPNDADKWRLMAGHAEIALEDIRRALPQVFEETRVFSGYTAEETAQKVGAWSKATLGALDESAQAMSDAKATEVALQTRLAHVQAQLDSEQALRKGLEKELEDALAKLTEPPAKPQPVEPPAETPTDKPKKKGNG